MRLSAEIHYDVAPDVVFAMLVDPRFQERKCLATGAVEHTVDVTVADDGGARITTRRRLPTEDVPDFVRSFMGATLTVVEVDDWGPAQADGGRSGSVSVDIVGAPVRLSGRLELSADGGQTHESIEGDVKASVPLVGGKIEQAVEPALLAAIRAEQEAGTRWLSEA